MSIVKTGKLKPHKTMTPAAKALALAKAEARSGNWTDVHNALFGLGGKLAELFPTQSERAAFVKTPEHRQIVELLADLQQRASDRRLADASGSFVVRCPKSIHAALIAEAQAEGVSMNQLIVAKLSAQLRGLV